MSRGFNLSMISSVFELSFCAAGSALFISKKMNAAGSSVPDCWNTAERKPQNSGFQRHIYVPTMSVTTKNTAGYINVKDMASAEIPHVYTNRKA